MTLDLIRNHRLPPLRPPRKVLAGVCVPEPVVTRLPRDCRDLPAAALARPPAAAMDFLSVGPKACALALPPTFPPSFPKATACTFLPDDFLAIVSTFLSAQAAGKGSLK